MSLRCTWSLTVLPKEMSGRSDGPDKTRGPEKGAEPEIFHRDKEKPGSRALASNHRVDRVGIGNGFHG